MIGFVMVLFPVQAGATTVQDEIMYRLLIDRFNNGDASLDQQTDIADPYAFHGGDLAGIVKKLDTLKGLGYTTIVLSPVMSNADNGYHGYWVDDFFSVEQQYGTIEDLNNMIKEAHDRDLNVIMEFVTNYVADTHEFATASEQLVKENASIAAPWGDGAVMLDQSKAEVRSHIIEAAQYWMQETELDGFKLHAADQMDADFLKELTRTIEQEDDQFMILADVLDVKVDLSVLEENKQIDAIDAPNVQQTLTTIMSKPGESLTPLIKATDEAGRKLLYVDNFYTKRFTQLMAENGRNDLTSWKLALTYLFTAPGIPSILQGSDIPMYGDGYPESQRLVQFNQQDEDVKAFFEKISAIRKQFPVLADGAFSFVGESGAMSVYKRTNESQTVYVALNNDVQSQAVPVTDLTNDEQLNGILGDNLVRQDDEGVFNLVLPRETAEIYIVEENNGLNWPFITFIGGVFLLFPIGIFVMGRKQKTSGNN